MRKYDFWGCWFRPILLTIKRVLPNVLLTIGLTLIFLLICYKYFDTNEDNLIDTSYTPKERHNVQLECLESNEVGNSYKEHTEIETIAPPTKIIESCDLDASYQLWLLSECERQDVDFYVVVSVMYHESRYNPQATNENSGCVGLMQLNPYYHTVYDYEGNALDMYAPCINAVKGIEILKSYIDRFEGNYYKALTKYVGGSEVYAESVLNYAEVLRNE